MTELAINGGIPARSKPLPENYPGAIVMGTEEAGAASEILHAQSPFRYYGGDPRHAAEHLENMIAEQFAVPYVLGVTSGTAAIVVALKALGIGYGDKVIVPANTFLATAGAVVCCNAVPVFCDVDESLNMDPNDLERVYDEEVKAILTVAILGNPVDMDPILAFAKSKNIPVVEDMAQSCGVKYKGKYAGTIGDVGVYSFQMNKIITAGEGGAVVTHNLKTFERAVRYHDQGLVRHRDRYNITSPDEENAFVGQNYRMSDVSGAILVEQWKKLDSIIAAMKKYHDYIWESLQEALPSMKFREVVDTEGNIGSNLGMILPNATVASEFNSALHAENINTVILYGGRPVYMNPAILHQRTTDKDNFPFNYPFKHPVKYELNMCPQAVDLIPRTVFLPIAPVLTDQDAAEIIQGIIKVYKAIVAK